VTKEFRRLAWIVRVLRSADILHFNAGTTLAMPSDETIQLAGMDSKMWRQLRLIHARYTSFLQIIELGIARLLGKKIYMTFQGDDLRQGDVSLSRFDVSIAQHVGRDYYTPESDKRKRRVLSRYRKKGMRFFILNPDLNWFLDGDGVFIPYSNVDTRMDVNTEREHAGPAIRIVHAPSHRSAKGSARIQEAIDEVRRSGLLFDFEMIEDLDNTEARRRIAAADLLIDQLYAGWYGGVAVEAMMHGVAVMSYIREADLIHVPSLMRDELPVVRADTDTLATKIEWFLGLSDTERRTIAENSRKFARRWHCPALVAEQVLLEYGDVGSNWPTTTVSGSSL
jgi:hypothetical protein